MYHPTTNLYLLLGGRTRRLGMETRSRRSFPDAQKSYASVCYGGQRCSTMFHGRSHSRFVGLPCYHAFVLIERSSFRFARIPVAVKSWVTRYRHDHMLDIIWRVRVDFITRIYVLLNLSHSIGGYFSSRVYASLGGTNRRKNAFLTATVLPT